MESAASKLLIRSPLAGDFKPIAELTNCFIRQTTVHFGCEELHPAWFAKAHGRDADRFPWLVAEVEGNFAGYAKSCRWRERAAYRQTVETSVYLAEAFRRRGIARALYEQLFESLRRLGFHVAVAAITLPNDASVRFHESVGFSHVGTFHQVGRKFERWHDVAWFERTL